MVIGVLPPFCALCAYCKARCKPYAYLWIVCSLTPTIVVLFSYEAPEEQKPVFAAYRCFNIVVGALVVLATAKMPPLAVRPPPHAPQTPYTLVRLRAGLELCESRGNRARCMQRAEEKLQNCKIDE